MKTLGTLLILLSLTVASEAGVCCEELGRKVDLLTEKVDALIKKVDTLTGCPSGWIFYDESCYYIDDTPTAEWSEARSCCQGLGGDLAIIRSAEENQFIFDLMKKQDTFTALGAWIGIQRKDDSKLYWIDDTPVEGHYSAWYSGQPDNSYGNEGCGHILGESSNGGKWNDLECLLNDEGDNPVILCQKPI